MKHEERIRHAKQIAKYLAAHGATIDEAEKILEISRAIVKKSVVDSKSINDFEGWVF